MASPSDQRRRPLLRQPPPRPSPPRLPVSIAALASSASNLAPPPIAARRLDRRRPPSSPSTVAAHGASKPSPHAQLIPVAHDHAAHLSSVATSTSHLTSISSAPPAIPRRSPPRPPSVGRRRLHACSHYSAVLVGAAQDYTSLPIDPALFHWSPLANLMQRQKCKLQACRALHNIVMSEPLPLCWSWSSKAETIC
ncbi:hypothetical protein DAI22_12g078400 [Oryza sativa Japonica Group]|nr:hypothetical protein DAI22_12g078400 [Oryza sativa Japonica Group]